MSNIPRLQALPPLTVYISPDAFRQLLHDICSDIVSLWTDAGTPEIVDGAAAHTLVLRLNTLPIPCAKVRYQRYFPISVWCSIEIEFVGDASTLPLYFKFIHALGNGLPDGEKPSYQSADTEREKLKAYAALYAKSLPSPEATPAPTPRSIHRDTRNRLNDLIQQRAKRIQDNQDLLSRTDAYKRARLHRDTVKRYAPELESEWTNTDYLPGEFIDTAHGAHLEQGSHE